MHGVLLFFFFNDTATTEIYTLSLHDALPICETNALRTLVPLLTEHADVVVTATTDTGIARGRDRSEEHTSELQSLTNLVCRLLLEKKKKM